MKRFGRRHKPKVRWLQEFPYKSFFTQASSVGTYNATLSFMTQLETEMPDPASATYDGASSVVRNPRSQLVAQPGWRMMRCVGQAVVALKQTTVPFESANPSPAVLFRLGLCVMDTDEDGNPEAGVSADRFRLAPTALPYDDQSNGLMMQGEGESWIWRRDWMLQNFGISCAAPSGTLYPYCGDNWMEQSSTPVNEAPFPYHMGASSNLYYQSIHLGPYFDIKRHVTLKQRQALFWRIGVIDLQESATHSFTFGMSLRYRTLIARQGRAYREFR